LLHQPNQDTPVKLEFANATTETHVQLAPRVPQVNLALMVLQVITVSKATMVYLATCHQFHWTPLANAFHAHMDLKDPTDQSAPLALQDQKEAMAKAVRPAPMAKMDQMVMQDQPVLTENQVNQVPKVTKVLTDPKANQEALDLRERKDQQVHQAQLAQPVKPKLELMAKEVTKDQTAKEVMQEEKAQLVPTANPEPPAKTPPIALAHDEARLIKPETQTSFSSSYFVVPLFFKLFLMYCHLEPFVF